jgi:hypothetical protein
VVRVAVEGGAGALVIGAPSQREVFDQGGTMQAIYRRARETYLFTNNHFRGPAALNVLELRSHLRGEPRLSAAVTARHLPGAPP